MPLFVGTQGDDILTGVNQSNASDTLRGLGGDDTIFGRAGSDQLEGGDGNDELWGGEGADRIFGGNGSDLLDGSFGEDTLEGGSGNDTLRGGAEADLLRGGGGDDYIIDEEWFNQYFGGSGHDTIIGYGTIYGETGNDLLVLRPSVDLPIGGQWLISGGVGNDTLDVSSGVRSKIDPGIGNDLIIALNPFQGLHHEILYNAEARNAAFGVSASAPIHFVHSGSVIEMGSEQDTVDGYAILDIIGSASDDYIQLDGFESRVESGEGSDTILGGSMADRILAGGGNDYLSGGDNDDTLEGFRGDDTLYGGDGRDHLDGGIGGNDYLDGGAGHDVLQFGQFQYGRTGEDTLYGQLGSLSDGGADNDTLFGFGAGSTTLLGGSGDDYFYSYKDANQTFSSVYNGGAGNDIFYDRGSIFGDPGFQNDVIEDFSVGDRLRIHGALSDTQINFDTLTGGLSIDYDGDGTFDVSLSLLGNWSGVTLLRQTIAYIEQSSSPLVQYYTDIVLDFDIPIIGSDWWDSLIGGAGDDTIYGKVGNDTIDGGAGDDLINGGQQGDLLSGGVGSDTLSYEDARIAVQIDLEAGTGNDGGPAEDTISGFESLMGSSHDDLLIASSASVSILGGAGNDSIHGAAGADTLDGGTGTDQISYENSVAGVSVNLSTSVGMNGDAAGDILLNFEQVQGSAHNDILIGDAGSETLVGGAGVDSLSGGAGDDFLHGGSGGDTLNGGTGSDIATYTDSSGRVSISLMTLSASDGDAHGDVLLSIEGLIGSNFNDRLEGAHGDETLIGGAGHDTLTGHDGNDSLVGGEGTDSITAGDGNDTLFGGAGSDILDGGAGVDLLSYFDAQSGVELELINGVGLAGDAQGDTLSGIENIVGSGHSDKLTGHNLANKIEGGRGNDLVVGLGGDDTLVGGQGADTIDGGAGIDVSDYSLSIAAVLIDLTTGTGRGGHAHDEQILNVENLIGSGYSDELRGDFTANNFVGGKGDDTLDGGSGADTLDGGDGVDAAVYEDSGAGVTVNLGLASQSGGDAQGDVLIDIENVFGSVHNDRLQGDFGANLLSGGLGADTLIGGAGGDDIRGGNGRDFVSGGAGDDSVRGEGGHDRVYGDDGNDTLFGHNGNDILEGRNGDDFLKGDGGHDFLIGGAGADSLQGNDGIDTADYRLSGGAVQVNLNVVVQSGADAEGDVFQGIENVFGSASGDQIYGDNAVNTLKGFAGDDEMRGGGGRDIILGGIGNDTLRGEASHDRVFGEDGNDILFGNGGNDLLEGGAGNDFMKGDGGVDYLIGGNGIDSMFGGAGDDVFIFSNDGANDYIGDWSGGAGASDRIQLKGYGAAFDTFAEVFGAATQVGSRVIIDFGGGDTLTLLNTQLSDLHQDDFLFS